MLPGDALFLDLDTVLVSNATKLICGRTTILRDFNYALWRADTHKLQSSVMYLTHEDRDRVWQKWIEAPAAHIDLHRNAGDQGFIETVLGNCDRWQDVLPGALVSYKVDIRDKRLTEPPKGAAVVVFHGQPRPWQVEATWIPRLS